METRDIIEIAGTIFGGLSALALSAGYFWANFKQGKNQEKIDAVEILTNDVDALRGKVKELTDKVDTLTKEIQDKDKKLSEALAILQGRDPALQTFITTMQTYIEVSTPLLDQVKSEVIPTVKRLDLFLNNQQF